MKKHTFTVSKSLNTALHNAELNTIDLLHAVGESNFPTVFKNIEKVAFRFGSPSAPYQLTSVNNGTLVEFAIELTELPFTFFACAFRALSDVEDHLASGRKLSKKQTAEKVALMQGIAGTTYNPETGYAYIRKDTQAETVAKEFVDTVSAFRIDGRLLERLTLKQLDKQAEKADESGKLAKMIAQVNPPKNPKEPKEPKEPNGKEPKGKRMEPTAEDTLKALLPKMKADQVASAILFAYDAKQALEVMQALEKALNPAVVSVDRPARKRNVSNVATVADLIAA